MACVGVGRISNLQISAFYFFLLITSYCINECFFLKKSLSAAHVCDRVSYARYDSQETKEPQYVLFPASKNDECFGHVSNLAFEIVSQRPHVCLVLCTNMVRMEENVGDQRFMDTLYFERVSSWVHNLFLALGVV
jgi:hypothetical protein